MSALPSKCKFQRNSLLLQRLVSLRVDKTNLSRVDACLATASTMFLPCWTSRSNANYKSATFKQDLVKATPNFVDVFYDNVGGDILDSLLTRMALHRRITVCGAIASYNNSTGHGVGLKNWFQVVSMGLGIRGFVINDYATRFEEGLAILMRALADGELTIDANVEHVVDGNFADVPKIWMRLFSEDNGGKLIMKL